MLPLVFLIILRVTGPIGVVLPVHLLVFFLAALLCHRELADDRPPAVHLTEFYFWVALEESSGAFSTRWPLPSCSPALLSTHWF